MSLDLNRSCTEDALPRSPAAIPALVMALALVLSACGPGDRAREPLPLGVLCPLSGPNAADGRSLLAGVQTAADRIAAEGGIPGFSGVRLLVHDTACDPDKAREAAEILVADKAAGVVGDYCSGATLGASEVLDPARIPLVTPTSSNEKITERGLKYVFRIMGRDDLQAAVAVRFMREYLKAESLALLDDGAAYSAGLADNVARLAGQAGITVLGRERVRPDDRTFAKPLGRIRALNPTALYLSLQSAFTGFIVLNEARDQGLLRTTRVIAQDALRCPLLLERAPQASQGLFLTFTAIATDTPAYRAFANAFSPRHGEPDATAVFAFDAAYALLDAIRRARTTDGEAVREALAGARHVGASKRIAFDRKGDLESTFVIQMALHGRFENFWNPGALDPAAPLAPSPKQPPFLY